MSIHSTAIVDKGAEIAEGVSIGPWCRVGANVKLSEGVALQSNVVIDGVTEIGARTVVHPFAVIGGPPQHLGYRGEPTKLKIGADCVIREYSTLNTGTPTGRGETVIGDKCFLMTGAHVGHDCIVGSNVIFANNATLGGHVVIGNHVFLGGLCAIHQFCRVGDYAFIGGCAAVPTDVIPYASATGNHAQLSGLNIIGMKRRGLARSVIHDLRNAYKLLFSGDGAFKDRLQATETTYAHSEEVMRIVKFIKEDTRRPLMAPPRRTWSAGEDLE